MIVSAKVLILLYLAKDSFIFFLDSLVSDKHIRDTAGFQKPWSVITPAVLSVWKSTISKREFPNLHTLGIPSVSPV